MTRSATRSSSTRPKRTDSSKVRRALLSGLIGLVLFGAGYWWRDTQVDAPQWRPLESHPVEPTVSTPPAGEKPGPAVHPTPAQVALYFSHQKVNVRSHPVVRPLPSPSLSKTERLRFALTQLLQGPSPEEQAAGVLTEIPPGTRLLSIEEGDGAVTVSLSPEFAEGAGAQSVQKRIEELSKTVRSIEKRRPVYLQIEGKPLQLLTGDGLEVDEPINLSADPATNPG